MSNDGLLRCHYSTCPFVTMYSDDFAAHMEGHNAPDPSLSTEPTRERAIEVLAKAHFELVHGRSFQWDEQDDSTREMFRHAVFAHSSDFEVDALIEAGLLAGAESAGSTEPKGLDPDPYVRAGGVRLTMLGARANEGIWPVTFAPGPQYSQDLPAYENGAK